MKLREMKKLMESAAEVIEDLLYYAEQEHGLDHEDGYVEDDMGCVILECDPDRCVRCALNKDANETLAMLRREKERLSNE